MTDLLERDRELEVLAGRLKRAAAGHGGLTIVSGPPGAGKTALLGEAARRGAALGMRVGHAAGNELERQSAWRGAVALFEGLVARATPAERRRWFAGPAHVAHDLLRGRGLIAVGSGDPFPVMHALAWLALNIAAAAGSLVLIVDDLQWLDELTLRFLGHLRDHADVAAIAIVGAIRTGEPDAPQPLLDGLERGADARLAPPPLSPAAVAAIARRAVSGASEAALRDCARLTGGNPFLVRQLVAEMAGTADAPPGDLMPEEVGATIARRLASRPEPARRLAEAAAVFVAPSLAAAAALAGLSLDEAARAADVLAEAVLLQPGEPLRYVHPLARAAVGATIPAARRALLHLEAATRLRDDGAAPARIAAHLIEGARTGESWVVDVLDEAARDAAASGAPGSAVRYLRRALDEPPASGRRPSLLCALGEAEAAAQEGSGIAHARDAVRLSPAGPGRAAAQRTLGRLLYMAGQPEEAVAAFAAALDEPGLSAEVVLEIEAERMTVQRVTATMLGESLDRAERLRSQDYAGDTPAQRKVLAMLSDRAQLSGEPRDEILALARRGWHDGALLQDETASGLTWVLAAGSIGWVDELDEYDAIHAHVMADARRRGSVASYALASYMRSFSHYYRGKLLDALADLETTIEAGSGGWAQFLVAAYAQYAWAWIDHGDLERAEAALVAGEGVGAGAPQALVLEGRARALLLRGDAAGALERTLEAGAILDAATVRSPAVVPWRGTAALAAAQIGDHGLARELSDEELALARRLGAPRVIGMALRAAGASRSGPEDVALLQESVAVLETSPAKLELARSLIGLGSALRRSGRREEAREFLRRGLDMAHRFAAGTLELQARSELTASGARVRAAVTSGAESLTPRERRVATMAAQGLTNAGIAQALFISRRTVDTHLTNAYRKLGISSREGLAAALAIS